MSDQHDRTDGTAHQEFANTLFDAVSDALKPCEGCAPPTRPCRCLTTADSAFQELHNWLRAGGVLPEPWRRATGRTISYGTTAPTGT